MLSVFFRRCVGVVLVGLPVLTPVLTFAQDMPRLMPYEASYLMVQHTSGDQNAMRAHLSLRYSLITPGTFTERLVATGNDMFISYTGEFDFYAGTRHSDPVVNRVNNPALHYRINFNIDNQTWFDYLKWMDLSLEHRSNGQINEAKTPEDIARIQKAYDEKDHVYFDTLSRSANYLAAEFHTEAAEGAENFNTSAKVKYYLSHDSGITWGPLAGTRARFADYDRIKLLVRKFLGDSSELGVEWTVGDRGFKTDSFNVEYLVSKNLVLPLYLRYHVGPMNTLSNYTQFQQSFGIGIKFTP